MSRYEPDEVKPEVYRDPDEDNDADRCPHGVLLAWYEGHRSKLCDDCQDEIAAEQGSESVGKG
jgi:hypothetical protein